MIDDTPEKRLFCEVMVQAVRDIRFDASKLKQKSKKAEAEQARENAISWFFNDGHDALISFSDVCLLFNIDKKRARDVIKMEMVQNGR